MSGDREGGCLCGAVRFTACGKPKFISNCHCHSCRKATGAAYSTWVGFAEENVKWTRGAPALDDLLRGAYYRWMFYAPGCIEPTMLDKLSGTMRENASAAGHGAIDDVLRTIDHALSAGNWLLGDRFSAADVVFGSTLNFAVTFGAFEKQKAYGEYLDRLTARPAYLSMLEKDKAWAKELGIE